MGRLQSANIAQAADTQADKVKLQIIDPPEIPRLPVAPERLRHSRRPSSNSAWRLAAEMRPLASSPMTPALTSASTVSMN